MSQVIAATLDHPLLNLHPYTELTFRTDEPIHVVRKTSGGEVVANYTRVNTGDCVILEGERHILVTDSREKFKIVGEVSFDSDTNVRSIHYHDEVGPPIDLIEKAFLLPGAWINGGFNAPIKSLLDRRRWYQYEGTLDHVVVSITHKFKGISDLNTTDLGINDEIFGKIMAASFGIILRMATFPLDPVICFIGTVSLDEPLSACRINIQRNSMSAFAQIPVERRIIYGDTRYFETYTRAEKSTQEPGQVSQEFTHLARQQRLDSPFTRFDLITHFLKSIEPDRRWKIVKDDHSTKATYYNDDTNLPIQAIAYAHTTNSGFVSTFDQLSRPPRKERVQLTYGVGQLPEVLTKEGD